MTPDVEDRVAGGPGSNGRSGADPEIHADADEAELQYAHWEDVVKYDHKPRAAYMEPPDQREGRFAAINAYREHLDRKKIAQKGYVMWFLIDGGWPRPRFVQPEQKGGGIPELEHDGHRYLFPKAAMLPSQREGAWTIAHRKGEADPINLRERGPGEAPPIAADALNEYVTEKLAATAPGPLSWLTDLDAQDIFQYGVIALMAYLVLTQVMGTGVI